jgi:hypothetical protein
MDDRKKTPGIVPGQREGAQTNATETVAAASEQQAKELFIKAKQRLLDINSWHTFAGAGSATFRLTDEKGDGVSRPPQKGDLICIDIPGPGPAAGDGDDWVEIEAIDDSSDPSSTTESIAIRVRPAPNPATASNDTAHFYTSAATSSFVVQREGNKVFAAEHGRNEVPNTSEAGKVIDKARNTAVALGAMAGMSEIQWKALVKGLLAE